MSIPVRSQDTSVIGAIVKAFNADRVARVSTNFHASATVKLVSGDYRNPTLTAMAVTAANASDLATSIALAKELRAIVLQHCGDDAAHKVKDTVFAGIAAEPTDLATGITFANDLKSKMNTHIGSTTFHYNADATNTIAAANATDQTSLNTLLNEIKTDLVAHINGALGGYSVRMVAP